MPTNVYVLRLQHGKYYVGKTSDPSSRIRSHFQGYGSVWTQMHPPIGVIEVRENVSNIEEDLVTKEYMSRYGWQNVRGGSYCNPNLRREDLVDERREVLGGTDRCQRCGRNGHWASQCYARSQVLVCYTCGREGHTSPQCYARTDVFDSDGLTRTRRASKIRVLCLPGHEGA
jgi:predicted GIY-YIG superfamily endonuclease